jgi:hypothetical protein
MSSARHPAPGAPPLPVRGATAAVLAVLVDVALVSVADTSLDALLYWRPQG